MNNLFNYDNKFFQGIGKVVDCFYLSVLWMIFCIPVLTAGASCTAAYYTFHKAVRGNRGYVWRCFWESFRSNFKQATVIWLICLLVGALLGTDAFITFQMLQNGEKMGFLYYVFLILIVLFVLWMVYLFSYVARFENTTKQTMKNAAFIAIANLPRSLLMGVVLAAALVIVYLIPSIMILMPAILCWVFHMILEKIYLKYMSPEDALREKEWEMEVKKDTGK